MNQYANAVDDSLAAVRAEARARSLFLKGYHCSEAVLIAVGEYLVGEVPPEVIRASNGFRGGVGSTRKEMCGAMAGGVMALGLVYGREDATTPDREAAEIVALWREAFLQHFHHTRCEPIFDLVHEPDGPGSCSVVSGEAACLLVRMLEGLSRDSGGDDDTAVTDGGSTP